MKYDNGKLRMDLIPHESYTMLAEVLTFGAAKYGEGETWRNVDSHRYKAALLRHLTAYAGGEKTDPESGLNHLNHALCNMVFYAILESKKDK